MKWDIRLKPYDGFGYMEGASGIKSSARRPQFVRQIGTECRYRPDGKRGRFECVIVVGPGPDDWQAFVTQYDAARVERETKARGHRVDR